MSRDLVYNLVLLLADGLILALLARQTRPGPWVMAAVGAVALMLAAGGVLGNNLFHTLRLYSFAVFLHVPLLLSGGAVLLLRRSRRLAGLLAAGVLAIVLAGVDAFLIEPTALEINRVRIETSKITRHLRIAVIADLQTDGVGEYERRALSEAMRAEPDLILLPGDYVQAHPRSEQSRVTAALRALMREVGLDAPLGAYAVRGNVEREGWTSLFDGLPVTAMPRTETISVGEVSLTGLAFGDSFDRQLRVERTSGFHIVFGHAPDFALGDVPADLLVAGHTHGGQVRLPLVGPLITLSRVPRKWASGVTQLGPGKTLIVSRGIGMERGAAPRMRFLCRPELVLIELVPATAPDEAPLRLP